MFGTILLILFYLLAPAGMLWLCNRWKFLNNIGPVLLLYVTGVLVGNMPFLPDSAAKVQEVLSSAIIPLAIPMMLFGCNFKKYSIKKSLVALLSGCVAVTIAVVVGYVCFKDRLGPEGAKIGGELVGVYTGGTPNLAALKLMLGVKEETYILLNSYDMLISFLYLVFLMAAGIRIFRRLLGRGKATRRGEVRVEEYNNPTPYKDFGKRSSLIQVLKAFLLSAIVMGCSLGVAMLFDQKYFMVVLILLLTTLGIVLSFAPEVKTWDKSYDAGMYLVYIFSIVVASMADLTKLDFVGGFYMLMYVAVAIFGSLIVATILAKLLRIDGDTMVISSVALINSPLFVPMIASSMKNKDVVITGITIGIVGYAAGNYLGYIIYQLLLII